MKISLRRILVHFTLWTCWVAFLLYLYSINNTLYFWDQFLFHIANIVTFYFFYSYVMIEINKKKRVRWAIIATLSYILVFFVYRYFTDYRFVSFLDRENASRKFAIGALLRDVTPVLISNSVLGVICFYFREYFIKKKTLASSEKERVMLMESNFRLQQTNLQLEKKQIELENAFLRAQINPHFLHNTLNFFFSKSISAGVYDLADAIMVLSNVMRFSLEAQPDENGRVPISQELDHLKNVIKINEIRFNKPYCLEHRVEGDPDNAKIIPLILITMVENAFKYGELFDPENPVKIHIDIHGHQFRFYLHNKKRSHGAKEPTHGIGVKNSIQRLEAAYGANGYSIDIQQDDLFYSLTLVINNLNGVAQPSPLPINLPETTIV